MIIDGQMGEIRNMISCKGTNDLVLCKKIPHFTVV